MFYFFRSTHIVKDVTFITYFTDILKPIYLISLSMLLMEFGHFIKSRLVKLMYYGIKNK